METDFTEFTQPKGRPQIDVSSVTIDTNLPTEQRKADFIKQVGSPYEFECNGVKVKCEFGGKKSLENYFDEIIRA